MADNVLHHRVAESKRLPRTFQFGTDPLTQGHLKDLLYYDQRSGFFYHRMRRGFKKPGSRAGTVEGKTNKCCIINIDGRNYPGHRLAWLYVHGVWPDGNIDHINGNPFDNRLGNLRDCDQSNNVFNRTRGKITESGVRGVSFSKNAWSAEIKKGGKCIHLGRYDTFREAVAARRAAEKCLFETIPAPLSAQTAVALPPPEIFAAEQTPPKPPLTAARLRAVVSYDPHTGKFKRLPRGGNAGKFAGEEPYQAVMKAGHLRIKIHSVAYLAHRLAWLYMTGGWPKGVIHHVNNDPADNRFANLQDATPFENATARKRFKTKAGLPKGVTRVGGRFYACIQHQNQRIYLGCFSSSGEAHQAYCEAAKLYHGEFARLT